MLLLLIFVRVAILGLGSFDLVMLFITFLVSFPETLITAIPEVPGPLERAVSYTHLTLPTKA